MQVSDAELVQQAQSGGARAFGRLVDRYKNVAYGAAYARLGEFADAQDVVQEAFLLAYRKLRDLQRPERFGNWLYSIVRNLCSDSLRARKDVKAFDETLADDPADPNAEHARRALHRRVQRAITGLSRIHRESITLHYFQGYSVDEISTFLDVPVGTVKRRLADARQHLKEEMIDMARELFEANRLPNNFRKIIVERVDDIAKAEYAKLYVRDHNRHGFAVEVVSHSSAFISLALAKKTLPRPFTYDFFHEICAGFQIGLDRVTVAQEGAIPLAELAFFRGQKTVTLQASPGYALALALAFDTPVYADKALLANALKMPEDVPDKPASKKPPSFYKIGVTPRTSWATFEETGGKPDRVRMMLNIYERSPVEKMPSRRTRLRRLPSADLVSLTVVRAKTYGQNPRFPTIWLGAKGKDRFFPIQLGEYEAGAIGAMLPHDQVDLADSGDVRERGRLYDVLKSVLEAFEVTCERVVIDVLHEGTFCALCCFRRGKKQIRLDARPSDSMALALRCKADIAVDRAIFDRVSLDQPSMPQKAKAPPAYSMPVGGKIQLAFPSRRSFNWVSSDPSLAEVSQEGEVKAVKAGKVEVVATWKGKKA